MEPLLRSVVFATLPKTRFQLTAGMPGGLGRSLAGCSQRRGPPEVLEIGLGVLGAVGGDHFAGDDADGLTKRCDT